MCFRRNVTQKGTNPALPRRLREHPGHETREERLSESDKMPNEKSPRKRACKDVSDALSLAPDNNLPKHRNVSLCADNVGEGRRTKKKTHALRAGSIFETGCKSFKKMGQMT